MPESRPTDSLCYPGGVPSEKRSRIRQNQAAVRARQEAAKKRRQRTRRIIIGIVVAIVLIGLIYLISRPSKKSTAAATPTSANLAGCPPINGSAPTKLHFSKFPPECLNPSLQYTAVVNTNAGTFDIKLEPNLGPKSADNFYVLSLYHYYNGTKFFRVIPGFVIQGGDPTNTGTGGPGYSFGDKLPKRGEYKLGTVAMARTRAPDSDGSQFFIISGKSGEDLPPDYTIFGQVTKGMSVIDKINNAGGTEADNGEPPKITYHIISITIQAHK